MCFHNSQTKKALELKNRYKVLVDQIMEYPELYHENGFNHLPRPVITAEHPDAFELYRWGLIPFWTKTATDAAKIQNQTLNAVSETVFEKPSFRHSIASRRCIIPSTGFFEWMHIGKTTYPHFIRLKSETIFSMAGIYEHWTDKETGQVYRTYAILTCPANPLMEKIHNQKKRMPVILPREIEKEWLNANLNKQELIDFFKPYPEEDMEAFTISRMITKRGVNTNVPEIMNPIHYPELELS